MEKIRFPLDLLKPQPGTLSFNEFGGSMEIPLEPFILPRWGNIATKVLIDCLPLQACSAALLQGQTLDFRALAVDDRPEGSVYMGYHHHPADLIVLQFGPAIGEKIEVKFAINLMFDFEGLCAGEDSEYANIGWQGKSVLTVLPPASRH